MLSKTARNTRSLLKTEFICFEHSTGIDREFPRIPTTEMAIWLIPFNQNDTSSNAFSLSSVELKFLQLVLTNALEPNESL